MRKILKVYKNHKKAASKKKKIRKSKRVKAQNFLLQEITWMIKKKPVSVLFGKNIRERKNQC